MCKCRLYVSVCIDKQRWNSDKCEYECKELIVKGKYDKRFIWIPSNSECEYDKSRDIGEYSDYEIGLCRKKLVDKLVEQYTKNIYEVKIAKITLKYYKSKWIFFLYVLHCIIFSNSYHKHWNWYCICLLLTQNSQQKGSW